MKNLYHLGLLIIAFSFPPVGSTAGILSSDEAAVAGPELLMAEVAVFRSIRQAMTLSISRCETTGECDTVASREEVEQVISALDARVDGLGLRQEQAGNSAGLTDVIIAYADERGGLNRVMKKIGDIESTVVERIDESELFGDDSEEESPAAEDSVDQFDDMFADEDEEI